MLAAFETEAGLVDLGEKERDMLYAFARLGPCGRAVRSDAIRSHELVVSMTHPTYHRTLRSLLDKGLVRHAEGTRSRAYVLALPILQAAA